MLLGITFALLAALANSAIDGVRKVAASKVPATALVTLPCMLESICACVFINAFGGFSNVEIDKPVLLVGLSVGSALLLLLSRTLYQTALAGAPLSLTVPYLSFTPAILVMIAFFFLGETPSAGGILGVCIITVGGYLLSQIKSGPNEDGVDDEDKAAKASKSFVHGCKAPNSFHWLDGPRLLALHAWHA